MLLVARVRRTLIDRALVPRGAGVIVGVSGGPDSTALLDVLARLAPELSIRIVAMGVDHGLREGAGAELDVAEAHASRLAIPFERARLTPPDRADHGWARRERYAALQACAAQRSATRIAVGHTLDDQAETVIARVLRGAGLRGLGAIDPDRADGVVRPLIDATRAEVRAYLAHVGVASVEDPSNTDLRFERVRVRANVLPQLVSESPGVIEHLAQLADEAREAERVLDALAARLVADARLDGGLSVTVLRAAPVVVAVRALRHAAGVDLGRPHLTELGRMLHTPLDHGQVRLPGRTALLEGGVIVFTPAIGSAAMKKDE